MSDLPEIDALLARVPEGTTPGPWRCEDDGRGPTNGSYAAEAGIGVWSQVLFDKALNDRDVEDPLDEAWVCGIWGALGDEDRANAALISLAPELVTALRALRAEVERQRDRSYALAVAIMGGEDAPGYADSIETDVLVQLVRDNERQHMQSIDREMRLARERDAAREALAPFAVIADEAYVVNKPDRKMILGPITVGDLRRARAALASQPEEPRT